MKSPARSRCGASFCILWKWRPKNSVSSRIGQLYRNANCCSRLSLAPSLAVPDIAPLGLSSSRSRAKSILRRHGPVLASSPPFVTNPASACLRFDVRRRIVLDGGACRHCSALFLLDRLTCLLCFLESSPGRFKDGFCASNCYYFLNYVLFGSTWPHKVLGPWTSRNQLT